MRGIHVPFLGLALIGLLLGGTANAQKAKAPAAVKVIVAADGSIKVIDVNTGKEIAAEIVRTAKKDSAQEAEEQLRREALLRQRQAAQEAEEQLRREALLRQQRQAELEALRQQQDRLELDRQDALRRELQRKEFEAQQKALQDALQRELNKLKDKKIVIVQPKAKTPGAGKTMTLKIVIGPDGKAQIVADEPAAAPTTVEGKLDLILKQLGDLRRDVDGIKKKLDLKANPYYPPYYYPWRYQSNQETKPGAAPPAAKDVLKKLRKQDPKGKKSDSPRIEILPTPGGGQIEIELDRIKVGPGPQAEEIQRAIEKLLRELRPAP